MADKGFSRYINLVKHIANPLEYIMNKWRKKEEPLIFITKPHRFTFKITASLYQVFKEIFMEDVYDIDMLAAKLPNNPVVIDIGANAGFFNLILLSKIQKATIFAYEPLPANVRYFREVIAGNQKLQESIKLYEAAVTGIEKSHVDLYFADSTDYQVVPSVFEGFNKDNTASVKVPAITLTKIIQDNNLAKIDLLKLDCEGSEYDIIYNTPVELLKRAKHLAIEVHDIDEASHNLVSLKKYLQELGYKVESEPINNFCHGVNAELI